MGEKLIQFKNWFFKVRFEKDIIRKERIEILSDEYDEGKFLEVNNNG